MIWDFSEHPAVSACNNQVHVTTSGTAVQWKSKAGYLINEQGQEGSHGSSQDSSRATAVNKWHSGSTMVFFDVGDAGNKSTMVFSDICDDSGGRNLRW